MCIVIGYTSHVIGSFRHKGLKLLYSKGGRRKVSPEHAGKIERILVWRLAIAYNVWGLALIGNCET